MSAVRTDFSTVNTTSSGSSTNYPIKGRLTHPSLIIFGWSMILRGMNWDVM